MFAGIKLWIYLSAALLVGAVLLSVYYKGRTDHAAKIEKENSDALSGADKGELRFKSCPTGWLYDFGTGNCFDATRSRRH